MQMPARFLWLVTVVALFAGFTAQAQTLSIKHDPVPFVVRGQPLTLKVKVEGQATPQSVTLYYALFRDAAPFRVPMKSSGLGYYVGAIEANLLSGVDSVSYYIEAQDDNGVITETPWYEVKFRDPRPSERPVAISAPPAPAPAGPAPIIPVPSGQEEEGRSWKTPALIVGGAAVVLGGAIALSQSGGGGGGGNDDDDGGNNSATNAAGTYAGVTTTCSASSLGPTSCDSHGFQLLIDQNGTVFTETLHAGRQLLAPLQGNHFAFTVPVNEGGATGVINYSGTWANNSVVGQISGTATSATGSITYSGSFSGDR